MERIKWEVGGQKWEGGRIGSRKEHDTRKARR